MVSASASTVINQPVEKVFSYVTSVENHKAWQAGIVDARISPAGPAALGSTYTYTSEVLGRKLETAVQISRFEANKKWAIKTIGVPTPVETVYLFEGSGSTTKDACRNNLTTFSCAPAGCGNSNRHEIHAAAS